MRKITILVICMACISGLGFTYAIVYLSTCGFLPRGNKPLKRLSWDLHHGSTDHLAQCLANNSDRGQPTAACVNALGWNVAQARYRRGVSEPVSGELIRWKRNDRICEARSDQECKHRWFS